MVKIVFQRAYKHKLLEILNSSKLHRLYIRILFLNRDFIDNKQIKVTHVLPPEVFKLSPVYNYVHCKGQTRDFQNNMWSEEYLQNLVRIV